MAITPENRKAFEKLGYQQVLVLLLTPMSDAFRSPEGRLQAQEWISEQERKQRRQLTVIAVLTLIAAAIAALPVVMGWVAALCPH